MTTLLGFNESRLPVDRPLDPTPATSSTGGSATSQAADLEQFRETTPATTQRTSPAERATST